MTVARNKVGLLFRKKSSKTTKNLHEIWNSDDGENVYCGLLGCDVM